MAGSVATIIARAFTILKGAPDVPWTAAHIAGITGLDVDQVARACVRMAKAGMATREGVSNCGDALYQYREGAEKPADGRGKHRKHLTGVKWTVERKRRANLVKARAAAKKRYGLVVLGVPLGSGDGR